jgi:hypothetical protein
MNEVLSYLSLDDIFCLFSTCRRMTKRLGHLGIKFNIHKHINVYTPDGVITYILDKECTALDIFDKKRFRDYEGNYVIIEDIPRTRMFNGVSILFIDPHIQDDFQSEESQFKLYIPDILNSLYILKASTSLISHKPKITINKLPSLKDLYLYANVNIELPNFLRSFGSCFYDRFHSLPYGITGLKFSCEPKNIIYPESIECIDFKNISLTHEDIKRIPKQVQVLVLDNVRLDTLYIPDGIHRLYLDNMMPPVRIGNLPSAIKIYHNDDAKILIKDLEIRVSRNHDYKGTLKVRSIKSFRELCITSSYIELIQTPTDNESIASESSESSERSESGESSGGGNRFFREILIFGINLLLANVHASICSKPELGNAVEFYSSKLFSSSCINDDIESISMSISEITVIIKELPKSLKKLSLREGTYDIACEYPAGLEKLKIYSKISNIKCLKNLPKNLKKLDISIDTGLEELILPENLENLVIRVGYKKIKIIGNERIFPKRLDLTTGV